MILHLDLWRQKGSITHMTEVVMNGPDGLGSSLVKEATGLITAAACAPGAGSLHDPAGRVRPSLRSSGNYSDSPVASWGTIRDLG